MSDWVEEVIHCSMTLSSSVDNDIKILCELYDRMITESGKSSDLGTVDRGPVSEELKMMFLQLFSGF